MIPRTEQELREYRARLADLLRLRVGARITTHICSNAEVSAIGRAQTKPGPKPAEGRYGLQERRHGTNYGPPRPYTFPGLPPCQPEFRFAAPRKWRFDWAWPAERVALEQEGGVWIPGGGRHTRGTGYIADLEKYAEAACRSWLVIRATPEQIKSGQALEWVRRALDSRK